MFQLLLIFFYLNKISKWEFKGILTLTLFHQSKSRFLTRFVNKSIFWKKESLFHHTPTCIWIINQLYNINPWILVFVGNLYSVFVPTFLNIDFWNFHGKIAVFLIRNFFLLICNFFSDPQFFFDPHFFLSAIFFSIFTLNFFLYFLPFFFWLRFFFTIVFIKCYLFKRKKN